ncbi:MAG: amidohydrolase [Actinomycetales bacterium]|nr:amidohydrolase [Actinomycetales bacterium]
MTVRARVRALAAELADELIALRRDLHAHPELGFMEHRTTAVVADRLRRAGLEVRLLADTGLLCDIGTPGPSGRIGLRADIDALPIPERTGLPFSSVSPGVSHACGHDLHTAIAVGAALILGRLHEEGHLPVGARVLFQPAEEVQPGGAEHVMGQGVLDGVSQIYAVHCDPKVDVGRVGSKTGPITSSSDAIRVEVRAGGGHTSRPHLTGDVVFALGQVITQTGAVLDRRLDARHGVNLTWGMVNAGFAPNAIPSEGFVHGTLRCLDVGAWDLAGQVAVEAIGHILAPLGVEVEIQHVRGLPPVVNTPWEVAVFESAARAVLGDDGVQPTEQSQGGEDFGWFLTRVPGAMLRLGTRTPGGETWDLHRGDVQFDEAAVAVGAQIMAMAVLTAPAMALHPAS